MESNITLSPVHSDSPFLAELTALYERAFPANERRPLEPLIDDETGAGEVFGIFLKTEFIGFVVLLSCKHLTHILYFAVEEIRRGYGFGSQILRLVRELHPRNRILADVEEVIPGADNAEQREKRIAFYLRNGYRPSEVRYRWQEENYVILVDGGTLTQQEFHDFWAYFYHHHKGFRD